MTFRVSTVTQTPSLTLYRAFQKIRTDSRQRAFVMKTDAFTNYGCTKRISDEGCMQVTFREPELAMVISDIASGNVCKLSADIWSFRITPHGELWWKESLPLCPRARVCGRVRACVCVCGETGRHTCAQGERERERFVFILSHKQYQHHHWAINYYVLRMRAA